MPALTAGAVACPTPMNATTEEEAPEPRHAFDDSRRLTGHNRWFSGTAATLAAGGPLAADAAALQRWACQVEAVATALGWPPPQPVAVVRQSETTLSLAAPPGLLFTATEVNEWAWEAACRAADGNGGAQALAGFDLAHPWAVGSMTGHKDDELTTVHAYFSAAAAAELDPALVALRAAASTHALPALVDDEALSLGTGCGSSTWLLSELPTPEEVPWSQLHAVPTALVTGSNGKTTTVRLLAAMAAGAGLVSGHCSTEAVVVGGRPQQSGDYAGPAGARAVLRDRRVQLAVLETARGGLLRRGLAVEQADVAVVTNLAPDHFGEYGIESLDDLAEVKLVVARALETSNGLLVLNADDAVLMAASARLPYASRARQGLFSLNHHHPALTALRAQGGATCGVDGNRQLLLHAEGHRYALGDVTTWPLTLGGAAQHNIANAAAAALAAWGLGLAPETIGAALQSFGANPLDNAGRLERWAHRGATVLLDYAHNPEGLAQLLQVARRLCPPDNGRLGLLLGQAGNRDDAALAELATTAARFQPDRVVLKELPAMVRGRAAGDVSAALASGLRTAGLAAERITLQPDEEAAALELLAWARPGDVVVLPVHTAAVRSRLADILVAGRQGLEIAAPAAVSSDAGRPCTGSGA
jgi:cyanophycin synthetase